MSSDTCHHHRNLMWGCSECELEGKLSALRGELSESRHEQRRLFDMERVMKARADGLLEERDNLLHRVSDLSAHIVVLEEELHKWRNGDILRAIQEDNERDVDALRERIAELEKLHDEKADLFASGRRYEQAWGNVRDVDAEDIIIDLRNQLEFERDRRIAAEKEEEGGSDGS